MELYIIRHGKTYWNEEKKIQGWADIELTEEGRKVAYDSEEGMRNIMRLRVFLRAAETSKLLLMRESKKLDLVNLKVQTLQRFEETKTVNLFHFLMHRSFMKHRKGQRRLSRSVNVQQIL